MSAVDFEQFHLLPALLETLNVIRESEDQTLVAKTVEACVTMLEGLPGADVPQHEKEEKFTELQDKLKQKCMQCEKYKAINLFQDLQS